MKLTIAGLIAGAAMASAASADTYTHLFNTSWVSTGGTGVHNFMLPGVVSVDSIEIELAHTWGSDLRIVITGPDGATYTPMFATPATSGSGNYDLGLAPGSGALSNVGLYTFTQAGPTQWVTPYSAPGTYNASVWSGGSYSAGMWSVEIFDPVGGDNGAVGRFTMTYTIPAPGAGLMALGFAGVAGLRRRRA